MYEVLEIKHGIKTCLVRSYYKTVRHVLTSGILHFVRSVYITNKIGFYFNLLVC